MEELFALRSPERGGGEGRSPGLLRNARLVLIDDVFTTGATLDAASRVLRDGGVGEIRVATIARVW
jgi:predicted amidophosphoribosyltransferase